MLPANQSEIGLLPVLNSCFYKLKQWIAAEIVDDDPWDGDNALPLAESSLTKLNPPASGEDERLNKTEFD